MKIKSTRLNAGFDFVLIIGIASTILDSQLKPILLLPEAENFGQIPEQPWGSILELAQECEHLVPHA